VQKTRGGGEGGWVGTAAAPAELRKKSDNPRKPELNEVWREGLSHLRVNTNGEMEKRDPEGQTVKTARLGGQKKRRPGERRNEEGALTVEQLTSSNAWATLTTDPPFDGRREGGNRGSNSLDEMTRPEAEELREIG